MLFHSEILGCRECHVGDEQTLHSGVLGGIDEGDDAVQRAGIGEGVAEEEVVVIGHTHTSQDNLVGLGTQCHHGHHLVEGLVGVGKEGNLLSAHQGIVEVDTGNTCGNEFAGLLAPHGIHAGTSDFHVLALYHGSAIDRVSVCIEEATGQLFTHLERGALAQEYHLSIGGYARGALENLQCDIIAHNLHHLCQLAVDGGQFIISHALGLEAACGLRYLAYRCIYFLKCCCHTY